MVGGALDFLDPGRVGDGKTAGQCAQARDRGFGEGRELADARLGGQRSEEHTSELQSLMRISYAVFCLKKKNKRTNERTRAHDDKSTVTTANQTQQQHHQ